MTIFSVTYFLNDPKIQSLQDWKSNSQWPEKEIYIFLLPGAENTKLLDPVYTRNIYPHKNLDRYASNLHIDNT